MVRTNQDIPRHIGAVTPNALVSTLLAWAAAEAERAAVEAEIARWCPPEEDGVPASPSTPFTPSAAEAEQAAVEAEIARWCPPALDPPALLRRAA